MVIRTCGMADVSVSARSKSHRLACLKACSCMVISVGYRSSYGHSLTTQASTCCQVMSSCFSQSTGVSPAAALCSVGSAPGPPQSCPSPHRTSPCNFFGSKNPAIATVLTVTLHRPEANHNTSTVPATSAGASENWYPDAASMDCTEHAIKLLRTSLSLSCLGLFSRDFSSRSAQQVTISTVETLDVHSELRSAKENDLVPLLMM